MTVDVTGTYWSEHRRAISDVVKGIAPLLVDAKVASVEADKTVRLFIEGRPATPKSYPVVASALPPAPGDVVWALGTPGGYVVFGRNLAAADKSVAGVAADARAYTDQSASGVAAGAQAYTDARIKRFTTLNTFLASAPPSAWDEKNSTNAKYLVMVGDTAGGWPGLGVVRTEMSVSTPTASNNAGFAVQRWSEYGTNRTLYRSGTSADGWTGWTEYSAAGHNHDGYHSLVGHNHDGYHSVVGHTHGRGAWNALATSWTDNGTAFMKIPATGQVFLRGRVAPPSTGWTDGTTIVQLPAGFRPIAGASWFCPGGFVSGVGHVAVMMAVETDGRLRAWSSTSNAVPPSVDLAPISYVAES